MIVTVERRWPGPVATLGKVSVDGESLCFSLEPTAKIIPPGKYPLALTVSGRAQKRELWCPAAEHKAAKPEDFVLPEVLNVPGRTAIRIHAGNTAADTIGCILVGFGRIDPDRVESSRVALIALMAKMRAARKCSIDITNTLCPEPLKEAPREEETPGSHRS